MCAVVVSVAAGREFTTTYQEAPILGSRALPRCIIGPRGGAMRTWGGFVTTCASRGWSKVAVVC